MQRRPSGNWPPAELHHSRPSSANPSRCFRSVVGLIMRLSRQLARLQELPGSRVEARGDAVVVMPLARENRQLHWVTSIPKCRCRLLHRIERKEFIAVADEEGHRD